MSLHNVYRLYLDFGINFYRSFSINSTITLQNVEPSSRYQFDCPHLIHLRENKITFLPHTIFFNYFDVSKWYDKQENSNNTSEHESFACAVVSVISNYCKGKFRRTKNFNYYYYKIIYSLVITKGSRYNQFMFLEVAHAKKKIVSRKNQQLFLFYFYVEMQILFELLHC